MASRSRDPGAARERRRRPRTAPDGPLQPVGVCRGRIGRHDSHDLNTCRPDRQPQGLGAVCSGGYTAPAYSPRAGQFFANAKSIAASSSSKCGRAKGMVCTAP